MRRLMQIFKALWSTVYYNFLLFSSNVAKLYYIFIVFFQQRCQTFFRDRDRRLHDGVGSDDDPAPGGHAADQDDADHLSLFRGQSFLRVSGMGGKGSLSNKASPLLCPNYFCENDIFLEQF